MPLGPAGHYPLGTAYDPSDQGHINTSFVVLREDRQAVLTFGTLLDWFILTPRTADVFIAAVRRTISESFGDVAYNRAASQLRVRADRRKGVVEVALPTIMSHLTGEPEFWLALVAQIETARKKL